MEKLLAALNKSALKLKKRLEKDCEIVYPFLVKNESDAKKAGKIFLENELDIVLMYHATYVYNAMSMALIDEIKGIFHVLFLSQVSLQVFSELLCLSPTAMIFLLDFFSHLYYIPS